MGALPHSYLFVGVAVRVDVVIKFRVLCVLLVAEFTVEVLPHPCNHVLMHLLSLGSLLHKGRGEGEEGSGARRGEVWEDGEATLYRHAPLSKG